MLSKAKEAFNSGSSTATTPGSTSGEELERARLAFNGSSAYSDSEDEMRLSEGETTTVQDSWALVHIYL